MPHFIFSISNTNEKHSHFYCKPQVYHKNIILNGAVREVAIKAIRS